MENNRDKWQQFEGEVSPSQRLSIRQRMAQLVFTFMEGFVPADLGDIDEEEPEAVS